jgi:dihydropteroate synthase
MTWSTRRGTLDLTRHARVMGILNVTPDSFSDGGLHLQPALALAHARRMIAEGAVLIDVGGESTRPGSLPVEAGEEIARTAPLIRALRAEWDGWISIDTSKAEVAAAALAAGADVVNDVSGLRADPAMPGLCAAAGCAVVVMHMQGEPRTMQVAPVYEDVVAEIAGFFHERLERLSAAGIRPEAICFDPGIGFGKTLEHNLALLRALDRLVPAGRPMLLGVSRKSFIAGILGGGEPAMRDWPTVAVSSFAREWGVMLHRVHAVQANVQALRMVEAILHAGPPSGFKDGGSV